MIWIIIKKNVATFVIFSLAVTFFAGLVDKVERKIYGVKSGIYLEEIDMTGYYAREVRAAARNLAIEKNKDPRNAHFDKDTGEVVAGVNGIKVDVEKTMSKVLAAKKATKIKLVTYNYSPKYGVAEIENLTGEMGSFVTGVGGTEERYNNVQLATKNLNYYILYPGETFSFNKVVGPRTSERGFRDAPIMSEGGTFLGPGGGVCQASSTLYNAVVNSKLTIVERHQHARPVGYVPPGMDATVDFAWLDLKFKNDFNHPVVVRGVAENRSLRMWILGPAKPGGTGQQEQSQQW